MTLISMWNYINSIFIRLDTSAIYYFAFFCIYKIIIAFRRQKIKGLIKL